MVSNILKEVELTAFMVALIVYGGTPMPTWLDLIVVGMLSIWGRTAWRGGIF